MVSQEEVEDNLRLDRESRSFEVKGPGSLGDWQYVTKVARAAMAMGNQRDGGQVVLGIDDDKMAAMLPGLTPEQVVEWTHYDNVSDQLAKYSDPPLNFHVDHFTLNADGIKSEVVVLDVAEFETEPHICKRDAQPNLTAGQVYVRPRGKPQSSNVPTAIDMRDLLNIGIDKGVREYFRRSEYTGTPFAYAPPPTPEEQETAKFEAEAADAWAAPSSVDDPKGDSLRHAVSSPAFTDVSVRLGPYQVDRIRADELEGFVMVNDVRLRGWPVPMVSNRQRVAHHGNWVGQDLQADVTPHVEAWRVFTSGQFLQRRVVSTDLRENDQLRAEAPDATGAIAVWDVLLYLVEVAELGARYASALGADTVTIDFSLNNIAGRELISGEWNRELHGPYITQAESLTAGLVLKTPSLLATPREHGVALAQQIFQKFGLNVPDKVFFDWQDGVLDKTSRQR